MKLLEKIKQTIKSAISKVKDTVKRVKNTKQKLKPVIVGTVAMIPASSFAQAIDLSALATKIDDQAPGLTGVGVSVTGLILIVALFGLAFLLLRSR